MVLGAGQRRQHGEFENVDRKLLLDDLDVALDALRRVARKAHDEARISHDAGFLPGLEHLAVFGDAVLALLHLGEIVRIDALEPDEGVFASRARRLLDEVRDLVGQHIDLDEEVQAEALDLAQLDHPVEDRLPIAVAGEIVVGDEEARDALLRVLAHDALDVVRVAPARFAALHIDDGAERALERAAAPGIEGGQDAVIALDEPPRQIRDGLVLQVRQVVHIVVDRLRRAAMDVLEEALEMLLRLAGVERDPEIDRLLELRRQLFEHRHHARDVEAADRHLHALRAELPGDRHGARELIRLDADETHDAVMPLLLDSPRDACDRNLDVHLVIGVDLDLDVLAEHLPLGAILRDRIEASH